MPLGADTIDILSAVVRRSNTDYSIDRISRDDYISIPNKTQQARPSQFFVDRQINPTLKLWPIPENSTDVVVVDKLMRMDDADTQTNTLEIPFRFYPCLAAGLAYYLAIKRAPDRVQLLKAVYEEEFERAASEDRDRASFNVQPTLAYCKESIVGRFASGKFAYGISDRSGFRYKLNEMKREWTGMLVGPDEFETKQPQLEPRRKVSDPEALHNPRPDRVEPLTVNVGVPLIEGPAFRPLLANGQVGNVTVTTS